MIDDSSDEANCEHVTGIYGRMRATALRKIARCRCWWRGCERHPQDPAPQDYVTCMHCGDIVSYGDEVGDTRRNRTIEWLWRQYRRIVPRKCPSCGSRFEHRDDCDELPF